VQCLGLRLLTDPSPENQTKLSRLRELHPLNLAPSELANRCFPGSAHAGHQLTRPDDPESKEALSLCSPCASKVPI
jgi:hypothetical protein